MYKPRRLTGHPLSDPQCQTAMHFIPPRDSGEGGDHPQLATQAKDGGRGAGIAGSPPPPRSLRSHGPPPPLRFTSRGRIIRNRSRGALFASEFCHTRHCEERERRSNPEFVSSGWIASLPLAMTIEQRSKAIKSVSCIKRLLSTRFRQNKKWNAGRRNVLLPAHKRRAGRATEKAACAALRLRARSPAGIPLTVFANGTFVPRAQLRARLPTSRAGRSAGRHDARAARVRTVSFRPRVPRSLRHQGVPSQTASFKRARLFAVIVIAAAKSKLFEFLLLNQNILARGLF
jgi:hypothetical protein